MAKEAIRPLRTKADCEAAVDEIEAYFTTRSADGADPETRDDPFDPPG